MFLTYMISLIKNFIIDDSDLLELSIYILNIKSNWFCINNGLELALTKPKKAACSVRSNRVKSFLKNKSSSFHKF